MKKTMHAKQTLLLETILKLISCLLSLVLPGLGAILIGKRVVAISIQASMLALIFLACWTRIIFEPVGVLLLVFVCSAVHLASTAITFALISRNRKTDTHLLLKRLIHCGIFVAICITTTLSIFLNKHHILGIHINYVPSNSMQPTLLPGDFILIDTWAFTLSEAKENDVVTFRRTYDNTILVKRVSSIDKSNSDAAEYFMLGDNLGHSIDSRTFGAIAKADIVGKVRMVLLSIDHQSNIRERRTLKKLID